MRKLAILGIILLVAVVALISAAIWNVDFRHQAWDSVQGTFVAPAVTYVTNAWVNIGTMGFTYIAATTVGLMIFGGLFGYFVAYELFWKRGVRKVIPPSSQSSSSTGGVTLQRQPQAAEQEPAPAPQPQQTS